MTTPRVTPLTPAQFAAAKRCQTVSMPTLRAKLAAGAKAQQGSVMLATIRKASR
jgi:hypothetical protein